MTSEEQTVEQAADLSASAKAADWREELRAGRIRPALLGYLAQDRRDAATHSALITLGDVQERLRAKHWQAARRTLEDTETLPALVNWAELKEQLATLQKSGQAIDLHKPQEALTALQGVDLNVLQAEAETQRGTAHIFLSQDEDATACFAHAIELDPKHYRALTNQGNMALEEGQIDEAIALYKKALAVNGDFANAHHNLGVAYRRKGMIGKSVSSIRRGERVMRREDSRDARESLSKYVKKSSGRWLKWLFYAAIIVIAYLLLKGRGIF